MNKYNIILLIFLFVSFVGNTQNMQVEIYGGAEVVDGSTITIDQGSSLIFKITSTISNCGNLKIESINLSNTSDFSIGYYYNQYPPTNIKSSGCRNGTKQLYFNVENIGASCATSTLITIKNNKDNTDFSFTLTINSSPSIYVLGGNPWADIDNGSTTTSATNATFFGVVEESASETRRYYIANIGSCDLTVSAISSSNTNYTITNYFALPISIGSYTYFYVDVTFTAPAGAAGSTYSSVISITSNDTTATPFTFTVSAEVFDYDIPGPGGVTADFRTWLKSTRGVNLTGTDKVYEWDDLGSNGKNAEQSITANQPTYLDEVASNINFNPVIKFENDGSTVEEYLYNDTNGFYSQDIFIVMIPDETISSSSTAKTIFGGVSSETSGDVTGVGLGNYTTRFSNEVLTYAQNTESYYRHSEVNSTKTYTNSGIINASNNVAGNGMNLLYNSEIVGTNTYNPGSFSNVGSISGTEVLGTKFWIGKNYSSTGSLNGRIAEIITYASRVSDTDRPKIESYLAIKYGITLGSNNFAEKNYINSAGTTIWDITANAGFNYNIAGIGRDDTSDLNQKQSKTVNESNDVTIGLGGLFTVNSLNTNEFDGDSNFLIWGCNNGTYTSSGTNTVTISSGITTSLTKIDRKWKIVETGGDVEDIYIGIPENAFSGFSKNSNEEYVLVVSETANFTDSDIIDVIPLKINVNAAGDAILDKDGSQVYETWYDFEGTKFFTFGKSTQYTGNKSVSISSGDYLVGEYLLNLNVDAFTISAWIKSTPSANIRTITAKGEKLQFRLNTSNQIEILSDTTSPVFTSDITISDSNWHQITAVYESGSLFVYVDGVLDKSVQNIEHPSPNFNHFSIGALFIDNTNIIYPFLGEIDEVYVWDIGLTQEQIRYLMNQEIEKVTGDFVNGKCIPQNITNNKIISTPWSNLRVYYDFNSFYGSTVEGLTDERNFIRINYLSKNKETMGDQTAALPYVSKANGVWGDESTWENGSVNVLPNGLSLDGSTYVDWNIVETSHDISSGNKDITVQILKNNSGKITIANPNNDLDELNPGQGLRVTYYLEIDGEIDLVGESQLVQDQGSILDEDSGGFIERDQQGTANSFNYNYWSSSVGPISGGDIATSGTGIESVNLENTISNFLLDGTTSSAPNSLNFDTSYTWADNTYSGAKRISTYWLYTFNGLNTDYNSWASIDETSNLLPGEGYTMKGTSGTEAITANQNYVFKGKPYNGDFSLPIVKDESRLIGNPYPSAIDADEFIIDNITSTINDEEGSNTVNVFNGALYFWDHFGEESSHFLKDYVGGYATYTLMGGAPAISNDARINDDGSIGTKVPEKYIAVNQGFFVIASLHSDLSNTTTTVDGGDILFKNSQRVFETENVTTTNEGSIFLKSNNKAKQATTLKKTDTRSKIRLQYSSPNGYYRQLLVGVDEHATNNFDIGYDALLADVGKEDMFWVFNNVKFVIQAVNNFDNNQELFLGLKTEKEGLIKISLESTENIDSNIEIYIKDKLTNKTYNINNQDFELNLAAGEYLDRFSLVFNNQSTEIITEIVDDVELESEKINVFMNNKTSELYVYDNNLEVETIYLFNSLGQLVKSYKNKYKNKELVFPVQVSTGIYLVKTITVDGTQQSKKIIIQ